MVDANWFKDKISAKRLTQRKFASMLGMDASSFSLMLQGKRRITIERAAEMARLLDLNIDDVCTHAGVGLTGNGDRVPILGHINGAAEVITSGTVIGMAIPFGAMPPGSAAYGLRTTQTALDMLNGWTAFAGPEEPEIAAALDRTAIVKARGHDKPLLRQVRRGATPALFTLTGIMQEPMHDVSIEWVRVILLFRPL